MKYLDTDLKKVILWQYENAPKLKVIVKNQDDWHRKNHIGFYQKWYDDFFNIDTANDFGLRLWARILNVPTGKQFDPQLEKKAFGFGGFRKRFGTQSNFGARDGLRVKLTSDQLRMMIKMRYFKLTNQPTLYNVNGFLRENLWQGDNRIYVTDPKDMTFAYYVLEFTPDQTLRFLIEEMDFLPRPCGVDVRFVVVTQPSFGFSKNRLNFNRGNFGKVGARNENI